MLTIESSAMTHITHEFHGNGRLAVRMTRFSRVEPHLPLPTTDIERRANCPLPDSFPCAMQHTILTF